MRRSTPAPRPVQSHARTARCASMASAKGGERSLAADIRETQMVRRVPRFDRLAASGFDHDRENGAAVARKYKVVIITSDGRDEQDELFETEEAAEEFGSHWCSDMAQGAEYLHEHNPGDYPRRRRRRVRVGGDRSRRLRVEGRVTWLLLSMRP